MAYLEMISEPNSLAATEAAAALRSASGADAITEADLQNQTEVVVDLDCLGELLADCANGSESACEEVDKTEPLPCLA